MKTLIFLLLIFEIIKQIYYSQKKYEKKVIASFTSYKNRLLTNAVDDMINSIFNQSEIPFKIVMTLYYEDLKYVNNYIKSLIDEKIIELIISDEDIKPHKKYFYTMLKYKNFPIITFDDDIIFENSTIESLVKSYKKYPEFISARRVHKMTFNKKNKLKSYEKWIFEYSKKYTPSYILFATNGAGSLFPPNILKIDIDLISDIFIYLNVDDIYLKFLEKKYKINTVYVKNDKPMGFPIYDEDVQERALYKTNCLKNKNDNYISVLNIESDEMLIFWKIVLIILYFIILKIKLK